MDKNFKIRSPESEKWVADETRLEAELIDKVNIHQAYRKGYRRGTQHGFSIATFVYLIIILILLW